MTLKERYELLAQEYDAASEYAHRTRQEMEEAYGVWMEEVTGVGPGDLVEYDGQRGIFDHWAHNKASKMTLVKKDGKAIRYITDYARLELVEKKERTTEEENGQ